MSPADIDKEVQETARLLFNLVRRRIASRRDRVRVFARATRVTLDALVVEDRGAGYVVRTWELPVLAVSVQQVSDDVLSKMERYVSLPRARPLLLSMTTRVAIDDLSFDEQAAALHEATQMIGTPP
jgi:hypothetical protein